MDIRKGTASAHKFRVMVNTSITPINVMLIDCANSNAAFQNNLAVGTSATSTAARVFVQGSGATSSTYNLMVINSTGSTSTPVISSKDDGLVSVGSLTNGALSVGTTGYDAFLAPKLYLTKSVGDVSYSTAMEAVMEATGNTSETYGLSFYGYSKPASEKTVGKFTGGFYQVSQSAAIS